MNSIDSLKSLYKPYKITIKGKCTILSTTSGNFVIKKSNNELIKIFEYLENRDFYNYPKITNTLRDNSYIYEYILDTNNINPHKSEDLLKLVGLLHSKTSYNKEIREDNIKEIYENIYNNIIYFRELYKNNYELFLNSDYMSPSEYLFVRNYSKIKSLLEFCENELMIWIDNMKEKNSERISLIHNNLSLDHYIKNDDKEYLISWDNSKFDTPIIDLVSLYQKEYWKLDFESLFNKYINNNSLNKEEEKLFYILISIPEEITFTGVEYEKIKNMRRKLDYIYKTEKFIKSRYEINNI